MEPGDTHGVAFLEIRHAGTEGSHDTSDLMAWSMLAIVVALSCLSVHVLPLPEFENATVTAPLTVAPLAGDVIDTVNGGASWSLLSTSLTPVLPWWNPTSNWSFANLKPSQTLWGPHGYHRYP